MLVGAGPEGVGRADELSRLTELVRRVCEGRGGLAWVTGEPGIGKSSLVDAAVEQATRAGCVVARGAGDELATAFPLRMMADCLAVSRDSADPRRARIARLLGGDTGGAGVIDPVLAASERLLELVDRLCADGPLVLVTEDLHWADEPSLRVWNRLARAVGQIPLLLVGTSRPAPSSAMLTRLEELVSQRGGELVELGALDDSDVHQLARDVLGAAPGPLLGAELARAGGNPLYVRELVDALVGDGLVRTQGGLAEFHGEAGATPEPLAVVLGRRLRFAHPETTEVLRVAALLGNDFGLDELAISAGRSVAELSGAIEEAVTVGLVHAVGSRLMFRHELIRQVLVEQLSTATRAGLHGHLARELAAAGQGVDVVARHLLAGAPPAEPWMSRWLAEIPEAQLYAAPQVAAELLDRALRSVDADDPAWEPLAARTAQVLFWLGRDEPARRIAREVANRTPELALAVRMNILQLRAAGRSGRPKEALAVVEAPVDDRVPAASRATLGAWSTAILAASGEIDRARASAEATMTLAARSGDRLALGYARHAASLVSVGASTIDHLDEGLAGLGEDPESMDLRLLLVNNRLTYLATLGRWAEAEAALPSVLALAEQAGTARAAWLLATAAEVCFLRGAWDEALVHLDGIEAEYVGNVANLSPPAVGALIALHRGEQESAEEHLRAAGVAEPSTGTHARNPTNWRLTVAWALHAEIAGEPRQAMELLATLLEAERLPRQQTRHEMMPHLVRLALTVDARDVASAATAACRADAESHPQADWITSARCCQAQLDDDADGLLDAAEEYHRAGRPLHRAFALEEAAERLAAAGDPARARGAFTDALNTYADLGASWDIRRTESRLRPYGIRRGPRSRHRRATSGWAALTPAESRIAELVAQGMSNPDIAARLFLSRRTVQTHVSNVLGKLGLSSRYEIAREAAGRQGARRAAGR